MHREVQLVFGHLAALDAGLEHPRRRGEPRADRVPVDVFHADAKPGLTERPSDAAAHDPRPHDADGANRRHVLRGGCANLLEPLRRLEDPDEVATDRGAGKLTKRLGFNRQAFLQRSSAIGLGHNFQRLERSGIQAVGFLHDPAAGLVKHEPATHRRGAKESQPPWLSPLTLLGYLASSASSDDPIDQPPYFVFKEFRGSDGVGQGDSVRLTAGHRSAREDHRQRPSQAQQTRKTLRAAPTRKDAEVHLRQTKRRLRMVSDDSVVAGQRHLQPAAETRAVDRRHRRHRKLGYFSKHRVTGFGLFLRLLRRADSRQLFDVRSGDEAIRFAASDHDRLDRFIDRKLIKQRVQFVQRALGERVDLLARHIESQPGDPFLVDGERPCLIHGHAASSATAAPCPPPTHSVASPRWT